MMREREVRPRPTGIAIAIDKMALKTKTTIVTATPLTSRGKMTTSVFHRASINSAPSTASPRRQQQADWPFDLAYLAV
jgi:hypothetical protein